MVSSFFVSTILITVGQTLDLFYCPFSSSSMVLVTFGWADFSIVGLTF